MQKLIEDVSRLVEEEYGRAGAKFGLTNNSDHETYAVLLEEFQEAQDEMERIERKLSGFWECVKANDSHHLELGFLNSLQKYAIYAACECIQVAAMAKKGAITICDRGAVSEFMTVEVKPE